MIGIYKITNTINGKCYIGQSAKLEERIKNHIKTLINGTNKNEHLQSAYSVYGQGNFTVEIIEECLEEDLDEREIFWIDFYKSCDRDFGYNKTPGGKGGNGYFDVLENEDKDNIRKRISEKNKGELNPIYGKYCYTNGTIIKYIKESEIEQYELNGWYKGVPDFIKEKERIANSGENNGFYGKRHSEETKRKISESRLGKNNWNFGKVIYHKEDEQKFINVEEVEYYESIGWKRGVSEVSKRNNSENKKGRKMPESALRKKSNVYMYQEKEYVGWRKLQKYLRENGYPKISESTIIKLSKGYSVRGYDNLFNEITTKET